MSERVAFEAWCALNADGSLQLDDARDLFWSKSKSYWGPQDPVRVRVTVEVIEPAKGEEG